MYYTNASTNTSSWGSGDVMRDLEEVRRIMDDFKVSDDLRKSRAHFDVMTMPPCEVCGERIEWKEQPYEHVSMCRHMAETIPKAEPDPMGCPVPSWMRLDAMPVVFK